MILNLVSDLILTIRGHFTFLPLKVSNYPFLREAEYIPIFKAMLVLPHLKLKNYSSAEISECNDVIFQGKIL